jgi:HEAT repeat protein
MESAWLSFRESAKDVSGRGWAIRRAGRRAAVWVSVTMGLLLSPADVRAVPPPSLGKELIPADMPADVRRRVEQLYSKDDSECLAALWGLREMGPAAVSAAPFLATMLDGHFASSTPNAAAAALARMGPGAFDAVAVAASSTGDDARRRAVLVLAQIDGPRAVPVIVDLFAEGLDGNPHVGALRTIGGPAREYLFRAVESPDANRRRAAVRAMPALSSLRVNYHDVPGVHGGVHKEGASPYTQATVDVLLKALGDGDIEVRLAALRSLARVASCRDKEMPLDATLRAALKAENPAVRQGVIEVVLRTDATDQTKFDALKPLAGDANKSVRKEAIAAISSLTGQREQVVSLMIQLLTDGDPAARETAALTLGKMRVTEAEQRLLTALEDPSRPVRVAAALALGRCGGKAGIDALMRLTKSDEPLLRFEATRALCERCLDLRGVHWDNRLTYRMTGSQDPWTTRSGLLPLPASLRGSFPYDDVRALMGEILESPRSDLHVPAAEALIEGARERHVPDSVLLAALKSPDRIAWLVALLHMAQVRSAPDQRFLDPLRHIARAGAGWPASDDLALSLLARMGDTETVLRHCERLFKSGHPKIVNGAVGILTALGDPGLDLLLKQLGDRRADVRETTIKALAPRINHPRVQAFVGSAIKSEDDSLRRGAEQLMASVDKKGAPPPTLEAQWRAAILSGGDEWRAHLRRVDATAVQTVKGLLQDTDSGVRAAAAVILGATTDTSAVSDLVKALADPSPQVRAQAAESLGRLGDHQATAALVAALADLEEGVVEAAAAALGRLGDPAAVAPLVKALAQRDGGVRRAAAHSLGVMEDARAIDALRHTLAQDPHWGVRQAAAAALGRQAIESHVPFLIAALRDGHWAVRRAAHDALAVITRQTLEPDPDVWRAWWQRGRGNDLIRPPAPQK